MVQLAVRKLIPGCKTSKLFVLELLHLFSSSLLRTDIIVFSKSNKSTVFTKPPSNGLEINKRGGPNRGFKVSLKNGLLSFYRIKKLT